MLCATRVISRKALECSGIGTDFYTQRNFSTILKSVSDHFIFENEWKSFVMGLKMSIEFFLYSQYSYKLIIGLLVDSCSDFTGPWWSHEVDSKLISCNISLFSRNFRPQPLQYPFTNDMQLNTETSKFELTYFSQ